MKKVDEVTHQKSGITVPIYLDKTTFVCKVLERPMQAPDAKILKEQILDALEHWLTLEWYPIIEVECSTDEGWGNNKKRGLWLELKRLYMSKSPAGVVLECDWDIEPDHRKASAHIKSDRQLLLTRFPLAAPLKVGKTKTWMAYTPEKWEALNQIVMGMDRLSAAVVELITTSTGNQKLETASLGGLFLTEKTSPHD